MLAYLPHFHGRILVPAEPGSRAQLRDCRKERYTMEKNTKREILDAALCLFADKGYDGVSVRDIAAAVGIRQSSLYKHYESKQDIFDHILKRMDEEYDEMSRGVHAPCGDMENIARVYADITTEELQQISRGMFRFWTEDPFASRFRRMLMIEQFKDFDGRRRYHEYLTEGPLRFMEDLFSRLSERGCFRAEDPRVMAMEFYGPITLLMARYDSGADREELAEMLDRHIAMFVEVYRSDQDIHSRKEEQ